ncbi:MAG: hypothetical protein V7704_19480 [Aurantimonas endophytica]|uniref:Bacteriophage-related protein n=1 Tax=Aurantimonas endophytica TaxID=1522175 RepID=A0A7W6HCG3_9HYPH|nr:hypothetical protein [Aurantimonas endophytica]MBB4002616.1 hypothetical protein [Aurantimonas endophytica]MCO6403497.1 hypothetical protein [Aurantimonas endophytica]
MSSVELATITVRVPLAIRKRGGRKLVIAPTAEVGLSTSGTRIDSSMIKAVARGHRWKGLLEAGTFASMAELAAAEKINPSYLSRILRLTLLSPSLIQAILDGRQPAGVTLDRLMQPFPCEWGSPERVFSFP